MPTETMEEPGVSRDSSIMFELEFGTEREIMITLCDIFHKGSAGIIIELGGLNKDSVALKKMICFVA